MERLVMRMLLLKSRIKSQIESLDQLSSTNKRVSEPPQTQKNPDIIKNLFETMTKDKEKPPAILKSLRVNYDDKSRWLSSNPLANEKETWIDSSHVERPNNPQKSCEECNYKEGIEEVLNILSICGFIKKSMAPESKQEPPIVSIKHLIEQEEQEAPDQQSRNMRIRFKSKGGLEHEFYY